MYFQPVDSSYLTDRRRCVLMTTKQCWVKLALSLCFLVHLGCDGSTTQPQDPTPYELDLPERFPLMELPVDNPMTVEGVELGRQLFFDPILSKDSVISCGTCHDPKFAFSDGNPVAIGIGGAQGSRNSMPLMNVGWMTELFWDGRAASLEEQALRPVENPLEMGESWDHVIQKLQRHTRYPELFEGAFQTTTITQDLVTKAIAQYERTLISSNSKYDKVLENEASFTEEEELGFNVFFTERGDCFHCHGTRLFTSNQFHNNGLDFVSEDPGLGGVTGMPFDAGKFKAPSLRNVEYSPPYMHDGRFNTLEEVIEHYNSGVQGAPTIDPLMRHGTRDALTDEEKRALVAFLKTLSDPAFIEAHVGDAN